MLYINGTPIQRLCTFDLDNHCSNSARVQPTMHDARTRG